MTSTKMYRNMSGETFAVPPLEDLRVGDWAMLPRDRSLAAEAWWIHADHPGFGADAEHTAACMRHAGFADAEIADAVACLLVDSKPGGDQ